MKDVPVAEEPACPWESWVEREKDPLLASLETILRLNFWTIPHSPLQIHLSHLPLQNSPKRH